MKSKHWDKAKDDKGGQRTNHDAFGAVSGRRHHRLALRPEQIVDGRVVAPHIPRWRGRVWARFCFNYQELRFSIIKWNNGKNGYTKKHFGEKLVQREIMKTSHKLNSHKI